MCGVSASQIELYGCSLFFRIQYSEQITVYIFVVEKRVRGDGETDYMVINVWFSIIKWQFFEHFASF